MIHTTLNSWKNASLKNDSFDNINEKVQSVTKDFIIKDDIIETIKIRVRNSLNKKTGKDWRIDIIKNFATVMTLDPEEFLKICDIMPEINKFIKANAQHAISKQNEDIEISESIETFDTKEFIKFIEDEMSWNSPNLTILNPKEKGHSYYFKYLIKDIPYKYVFHYECMPGSSVLKDLKNAAKSFDSNMSYKILRDGETGHRATTHEYIIIVN